MTQVALFHPDLGVRAGTVDAADRLRAAGHGVTVVDQYDGRVFADHAEAGAYVAEVGFPALMQRALDGVAALPDGFVAMGFSNGAGMAEHVALQRPVGGAVLCSGMLPLTMLGVAGWPARTPVQAHWMTDDPYRHEGWADSVVASVRESGAAVDVYSYSGVGHLFTDPDIAEDYDAAASELLWSRVLPFVDSMG